MASKGAGAAGTAGAAGRAGDVDAPPEPAQKRAGRNRTKETPKEDPKPAMPKRKGKAAAAQREEDEEGALEVRLVPFCTARADIVQLQLLQ